MGLLYLGAEICPALIDRKSLRDQPLDSAWKSAKLQHFEQAHHYTSHQQ